MGQVSVKRFLNGKYSFISNYVTEMVDTKTLQVLKDIIMRKKERKKRNEQ